MCSRARTAPGRAGFSIISRRRRRTGASRHRASSRPCSTHLGPIWPSRLTLGGVPLGDTWRHPAIKRGDATDGLVPIHKLSQWLSYSLIEPLQWSGIAVTDIDGLTGLAEYRNGGLFVDAGVLRLRNPEEAIHPNAVGSELVVEWRALTVALLDEVASLIRARRGLDHRRVSAGARARRRHLGGGPAARAREASRRRAADCGRERRHRILISFPSPAKRA